MPYCSISDDLKLAVIHLYNRQLLSIPDILDAVGISHPTFFHVLKQYHATGHVSKSKSLHCGRPRALNYSDIYHLLKLHLLETNRFISKLHRVAQEQNEDLHIDYMHKMAQYGPDELVFLNEVHKNDNTPQWLNGQGMIASTVVFCSMTRCKYLNFLEYSVVHYNAILTSSSLFCISWKTQCPCHGQHLYSSWRRNTQVSASLW
ncbi:hypothetical protein BDR06DRAFT_984892 [Suillus hirtellus]|nr:hypothetical protein BDR06DRAFT_984892 [Suillus hirtellus]